MCPKSACLVLKGSEALLVIDYRQPFLERSRWSNETANLGKIVPIRFTKAEAGSWRKPRGAPESPRIAVGSDVLPPAADCLVTFTVLSGK